MRFHPYFIVAALIPLAACSLLTGPDRVLGILHMGFSEFAPPAVEAPDTVDVGQPFDLIVRTYGSNGCWRAAGGDVKRAPGTIRVAPMDANMSSTRTQCTTEIVRLPRVFHLVISEPGEVRILVTGRGPDDGTITLERRVVVR